MYKAKKSHASSYASFAVRRAATRRFTSLWMGIRVHQTNSEHQCLSFPHSVGLLHIQKVNVDSVTRKRKSCMRSAHYSVNTNTKVTRHSQIHGRGKANDARLKFLPTLLMSNDGSPRLSSCILAFSSCYNMQWASSKTITMHENTKQIPEQLHVV